MSQSNCSDFHPKKYQFKSTYYRSSSQELIVNSRLASKYMLLDIELWTWKKSDRFYVEPHLPILSGSTIILPAFTLEDFAGFDHRDSTSKSIKSGTFIWITMSPLEAISWRKNLGVLPDSWTQYDDLMIWIFERPTSIPPPQCHHLLLVSRIIHINPFLVSALVGAENQVQHGTIKTIVGLRLHSDDGWDFWRGDCHQREKLT